MTYLASAILLATIVVRPVDRRRAREGRARTATRLGFLGELREGWHFLRDEPTLLREHASRRRSASSPSASLLALMYAYAAQVFDELRRSTGRRSTASSRRASAPAT